MSMVIYDFSIRQMECLACAEREFKFPPFVEPFFAASILSDRTRYDVILYHRGYDFR